MREVLREGPHNRTEKSPLLMHRICNRVSDFHLLFGHRQREEQIFVGIVRKNLIWSGCTELELQAIRGLARIGHPASARRKHKLLSVPDNHVCRRGGAEVPSAVQQPLLLVSHQREAALAGLLSE